MLGVALGGVLEDPSFRFCHENRDFTYNESLCPLLLDAPGEACEGLRAFCADPDAAPPAGCSQAQLTDGEPSSSASDQVEEPWESMDSWSPNGCSASSPEGAGSVLAWFVAFLVGGLVAAIGLAILRSLGLQRARPVGTLQIVRLPDEEDAEDFLAVVDDVPDLPPDGLLGRAREALSAGDLGESALLARGAVLRSLGERGELRLHRARTDREYVRQVQGERADALDEVLDVAEQHRWGRVPLEPTQVETALAAAARLLAPLMLLLAALPAHADERFGPAGDVALRRLVDLHAEDVGFHRGSLAEPGGPGALFLDTTAVAPSEEDWEALLWWVEEGNLLVVTGDVPVLGVREQAPGDCTSVYDVLPNTGSVPLGYVTGDGLVTCGEVHPVTLYPWLDGLIVGIADPLLFWNGAMVDPRNEAFWEALLADLQEEGWLEPSVRLATWGQGSDTPPTTALANLNLLPFAVQVLLLWAAVLAWRGPRFGRPTEGTVQEERPFVEHVEAMAEHYRRLAADEHVARAYARWMLATHRADGLRQEALRHGMAADDVDRLVAQTCVLAEGGTTEAPLENLEELWKITRPST